MGVLARHVATDPRCLCTFLSTESVEKAHRLRSGRLHDAHRHGQDSHSTLLTINSGDDEQTVRANVSEALRLILVGIEANEFRQAHALRYVATALGFLVSRCYREAARSAEQALSGVALSTVPGKVTVGELMRGVTVVTAIEEGDRHGSL